MGFMYLGTRDEILNGSLFWLSVFNSFMKLSMSVARQDNVNTLQFSSQVSRVVSRTAIA